MSMTYPMVKLGDSIHPRNTVALARLKAFLAGHHGGATLTTTDGASTELPDEIYEVITQAVDALASESAVAIAPVSTRVTTTQAADVLGVSRPTLVKILERGEIPFEHITTRRTMLLDDVLAFRDRRRVERHQALKELTDQAQKYGLYDDTYKDYAPLLDDARHHRI